MKRLALVIIAGALLVCATGCTQILSLRLSKIKGPDGLTGYGVVWQGSQDEAAQDKTANGEASE